MDVVSQDNRSAVRDAFDEKIDARVDLTYVLEGPVEGVDVGVDDVVAEVAEDAECLAVVAEERRAHVRGDLADDFDEGVFEFDHLVGDLLGSE